jgi:hypothetical protein
VTHQGLRFTLLWVLLAMFVALYDHDRRRAPPKTSLAQARARNRVPVPGRDLPAGVRLR